MQLLSVLKIMNYSSGIILLGSVMIIIIIDLLTVAGIRALIPNFKRNNQIIVYSLLWSVTAFIIIFVTYQFANPTQIRSAKVYSRVYFITGCVAIFYFPKILFIAMAIADDLFYYIFIWLIRRLGYLKRFKRRLYLHKTGVVLGSVLMVLILYGISVGRFQYKINRQTLYFKDLPKKFDGFRIVHLSDIHTGGFYEHTDKLQQWLSAASNEKPDLILISGDFVSYFAEEFDGLENIFYSLQAPYGQLAVLGNHDYADYYTWRTFAEKSANVQQLVRNLRYVGIKVLRNETMMIHKDSDKIAIVGVENWGPPPFQQYGDLSSAMYGVPDSVFKILLSHNPKHWEEQVKGKVSVPLTLSGHTHAMQMGVKIGSFQWSPASFLYKYWSGLYEENGQYLYVNQGLGYVGFPFRIGVPAEITVLTLKRK